MPQLPAESAVATALRLDAAADPDAPTTARDPEIEQWSRVEELLAGLRDEMHTWRWQWISSKADKGNQPRWRPEPLLRPGVSPPGVKSVVHNPEQRSVLAEYLSKTQQATYN